jgi:hypothetical protein
MRLACALALATLAVSACTSAATTTTTTTTTPPPASAPAKVPPSPVASASPNPEAQGVVDEAVRTAAAYANVAAADVKVQQIEAREWPDSSLGCPRPGLMYSQIVTPGYLIVVQAGSRVLEYHSDARGSVVLCQER